MKSSQIITLIKSELANSSTSLPAIVLNYNSTAQTVEVELCTKRPYSKDTSSEQPIRLSDVPVMFPQGSDWVIAGPIVKGDTVYIHFAMFDCDPWMISSKKNKVQEAGSRYYHDINNAFATTGAFNYNNPTIDSRFRNKFHIVQGNNFITMENGRVEISSSDSNSKIIMQGGQVTIDADVTITGTLDVQGDFTAPTADIGGQQMFDHTHTARGATEETSSPNNNPPSPI